MHSLLLFLKNKFERVGKFRPIVISKRAHNRTSVFVFRNLKTGEMIVKFPGECKSFVENTLHGNYNSVMSQRSSYPDRDIPIYLPRTNYWAKPKCNWILLAKNQTNVHV